MKFYTNVFQRGNNILVRGYDNGKRFAETVKYKPYLFVPSKDKNIYKSVFNKPVEKMSFSDISSAKDFIFQYKTVSNFDFYGITQFVYTYIFDNYFEDIKYDPKLIEMVTIDIEIGNMIKDDTIETACEEVTAITLRHRGFSYVFGVKDFRVDDPSKVKYYKCKSEEAMLRAFITEWKIINPDVVTGYNIELFDIPYLVNRITKLIGEDKAKELSPWNYLESKKIEFRGRTHEIYIPAGVSVLDYYALYRKFTYVTRESYSLGYIASIEVNEKKLDYSEYDSIMDMYDKNYQKFIEYNIHDCALVEKIDDKLKLIELVYAIAYDAKVNLNDALTSVRLWDVIIHHYLLKQRIVVPQFTPPEEFPNIVGGYVKSPQLGMHKWVVSFDLNSLYPHLIMEYNISPETFKGMFHHRMSVDELLNNSLLEYWEELKNNNISLTSNMCTYDRSKRGFLPSLMDKMYQDRVVYKKQMIDVKKQYEKDKTNELLSNEIARLNNLQLAKKIQLNSAYGALANQYFRWFDTRHAEAITMSGQFAIRWIEKYINQHFNKILKTENVDYVLASDTDSVYVSVEKFVSLYYKDNIPETSEVVKFIDKLCKTKIEPFIDNSYKQMAEYVNAYDHKMFMKRESIADKGIWRGKKMYILNVWDSEGIAYTEPQLKTMGIEAVRSSIPSVCRENIKNALKIIMNKTQEDLIDFIDKFREDFMNMSFEAVASPRGINGMIKYRDSASIYKKGTPIHVKGALIYNHLLKTLKLTETHQPISNGDKIKFSYLKEPNPAFATVISAPGTLPKQMGLDSYIDKKKQFDKSFLEPIRSITSEIGWGTEVVFTLESFFVDD